MQQLELEKACCFKKSRNLPFKGKRPALSLLDVFFFPPATLLIKKFNSYQ